MGLVEWLKARVSRNDAQDDLHASLRYLVWGVYSDLQHKNFGEARRRLLGALERRDEINEPILISYILIYLGVAWLCQDKYHEAIQFFSEYLERYPNDPAAYTQRGAALWYSGQQKDAIQDYSRALQLAPTNIEALTSRGQVLAESGEYHRALQDLDVALDCLRQNPGQGWERTQAYIRNGRAAALAGLADYEGALKEFEASTNLSPENAWVYFNRAQVYDLRGETEKAVSDYRTALAKGDPKLCLGKKEHAESRLRDLIGRIG